MLVLDVPDQVRQCGFENMAGWNPARWHAPALAVEQQGCLRLCAGQAEPASVAGRATRCGVVPQQCKACRNVVLGQPGNIVVLAVGYVVQTVGRDELNRTGAVLSHLADQRERIARRNAEQYLKVGSSA